MTSNLTLFVIYFKNSLIQTHVSSIRHLLWRLVHSSILFSPFQPIGIHNGKYEWASRPSTGDCSLKVMNVDIKFDDGEWACQVTSADFQSQDALASQPARLVVRGMRYKNQLLRPILRHNLRLKNSSLSCLYNHSLKHTYISIRAVKWLLPKSLIFSGISELLNYCVCNMPFSCNCYTE